MSAKAPTTGTGARKTPPQTGPANPAERPVVPAVPSESGVGEEDPGDYENACIRSDDGLGAKPAPPKPRERS